MTAVAAVASSARATLIDDFNTPASAANYTRYTVLDQDATVDTTISSPSGVLQVTKAQGNSAEQNLYLRSDYVLGVGQQLRVDYIAPSTTPSAYGDFGIVISATPTAFAYAGGTTSIRADYAAVYVNASQNLVKSIAFNALNTQVTNVGGNLSAAGITNLFITHVDATTYQTGYTVAGVDTVYQTYTLTNPLDDTNIGFYSDLRGATSAGTLDNLQIVSTPEPASLGLLSVGAMGLLARRRRA